MERIIDLKKEEGFIEAYISLRNRYHELLLTRPVYLAETKEWLKDNEVEIRGLVQDNVLLGVVILYLNRDGEIAVFVKDRHHGIGTKLLRTIEQVARKRNLESVWAWVVSDNRFGERTFLKNGYTIEGQSSRIYQGQSKTGNMFRRRLL